MTSGDARATPPQLATLTTSARFSAMQRRSEADAAAAPALVATGDLRLRLMLAPGAAAGQRALEAAVGGGAAVLWRPVTARAALTAASAPPARGSSPGSGVAPPPRSPELVAAAARAQGGGNAEAVADDTTAAADAFLSSLRANGTDARLPTALLAAASPLLALPPLLPAPEAAEAQPPGDAVALAVPPFATHEAPDAFARASLLATMLRQLDCCGWLGPGRIDAETVERLCAEFRPGAAAAALHEVARRFLRHPQRELPVDTWHTCVELAKRRTNRLDWLSAYLRDREQRSLSRYETPAAEPYLPPGAQEPKLSLRCENAHAALDAFAKAGWVGNGQWHIGRSLLRLLSRWRNQLAVVTALRRLPRVASAAEIAAGGCPLNAILYEELLLLSRNGVSREPKRARQAMPEQPRRRDSPPRGSRERRSRSRDRTRRRSRSREHRGSRSRHEHRSRSRSRDRAARQQSPMRSADAAPGAASPAVLRGGACAPPCYHSRNPLSGDIEPARPLQWFRERVLGGSIQIAVASAVLVWRAGAQESTAAPLALILAAQQE